MIYIRASWRISNWTNFHNLIKIKHFSLAFCQSSKNYSYINFFFTNKWFTMHKFKQFCSSAPRVFTSQLYFYKNPTHYGRTLCLVTSMRDKRDVPKTKATWYWMRLQISPKMFWQSTIITIKNYRMSIFVRDKCWNFNHQRWQVIAGKIHLPI